MPQWVVSRGAKYGLSGTVADGGGTGIESVTITLSGDASDTTSTAADGTWSFIDLKKGSYTVTPTKTNYTFYPTSSAQTITNADISGIDFVSLARTLLDQFITADGAPITSPRTCEPGPGGLTSTQTDGTLAIASGVLAFTAQATPTWGDQGFYATAQTRDSGLALSAETNLTTWEEMGIGWHTATAVVDPDSAEHAIQANTTNGRYDDDNATPIITGLSASTDYNLALILRSVGCHYVLDGKLLWVDAAGATATLYPCFLT